MKVFYLIILILLFFESPAFGYHCYFQTYFGDIRVANINGRKIYISFAPHPFIQATDIVGKTLVLDPIEASARLQDIISDNLLKVIDPKMYDFSRLSLLLASGQIDWIGIEDRPADLEERWNKTIQNYLFFKNLFTILEALPTWDQTDTYKILHYVYPTPIIFEAEYPNDLSKIRIVPLEESDVHIEAGDVRASLRENYDKLSNLKDGMSDEQASAFLNFFSTTDSINPQAIETFLEDYEFKDQEIIKKIRERVDLHNKDIMLDPERDKFVVQNILAQEGNGIVIRGKFHQENVESGLTEACLESMRLQRLQRQSQR